MSNILEIKSLVKSYKNGTEVQNVLQNVSFSIAKNSMVNIFGISGSGKTTLLHILGLLLHFDNAQKFVIDNTNILDLSVKKIEKFRKNNIAFIYQSHHLLKDLTVFENVFVGSYIKTKDLSISKKFALKILQDLGLSLKKDLMPSKLSGGEKQRVSIARAIVTKPKLLIADEPTGNLDRENAKHIMEMLRKMCIENSISIIIATHDESFKKNADKNYNLNNGIIEEI